VDNVPQVLLPLIEVSSNQETIEVVKAPISESMGDFVRRESGVGLVVPSGNQQSPGRGFMRLEDSLIGLLDVGDRFLDNFLSSRIVGPKVSRMPRRVSTSCTAVALKYLGRNESVGLARRGRRRLQRPRACQIRECAWRSYTSGRAHSPRMRR
jgi:hypothetical protein